MKSLPSKQTPTLPQGLTLEDDQRFAVRMVMTPELQTVMREVIHQWRHRDRFQPLEHYGIRPLDRLLFYGPPGNGKTMSCYWIARELKVPMYRVLCSQLRGSHLGETTRNVAGVVDFLGGLREPAVCLWDEVESIFVDRRVGSGECDREIAAALTVFMQAIDRWKAPTLLVMATNLVDNLDFALISRVEMRLEFGPPTPQQSAELLAYWAELLHEHGADEWAPAIADSPQPKSFRELQQTISRAARDWTARQCR